MGLSARSFDAARQVFMLALRTSSSAIEQKAHPIATRSARAHQSLRVLLVAKRSRAVAELAWFLTAQGQRVTFVWESAHAQVEIRARKYDCVLVERDAFPDMAIVIRALRAGNTVPIMLVACSDVADYSCE